MKFIYPVTNKNVVNGFGPRESFQLPDGRWTLPYHYGIDFPLPEGTPIFAIADGEVLYNQWDDSGYGGGWAIAIKHAGGFISWYLHRVEKSGHYVGQVVKQGDVIGRVGTTGASTGPHLHLELHLNGEAVDPLKHLGKMGKPVTYVNEDKEDDMKPTVHLRTEGAREWTRAHPDIGKTLKPGASKKDGNVMIYRGFEATSDPGVGVAWARQYAGGSGKEHSATDRAGYIAIQKQATRLSVAVHG